MIILALECIKLYKIHKKRKKWKWSATKMQKKQKQNNAKSWKRSQLRCWKFRGVSDYEWVQNKMGAQNDQQVPKPAS